MVRVKFHVMRNLRLKIKSGFIKEEPADYLFMKRYPPITRDNAHTFNKPQITEIPYIELYEKALGRNPMYDDERVYPAYWNQEPQALTLAKKQYEHIQNGMDEESAYQKAIAYVNELEGESFLEMEKVSEAFSKMGARAPFMTVPSIATEIKKWREALKGTSFLELDLADQGEIDYLIQTKILQWNEVDRERRMKDPVFEMQFSKFRESLFPLDAVVAKREAAEEKAHQRLLYMDVYNVNADKLTTKEPFFAEDYIEHFERVRDEPDLRKWSSDNRASLSRWIVDTLALQEIVDTWSNEKVQSYLNRLRVQYFPMIHFPDRAMEFAVPDVATLKQILYSNDIGYKMVDDKLFVRRAYRIPMLLFPQETLASSQVDEEEEEEENRSTTLGGSRSINFSDDRERSAKELRMDSSFAGEKPTGHKEEKDRSMNLLDDILSDSFHVDDSVAIKSNASRLAGLREAGVGLHEEVEKVKTDRKLAPTERSGMSAAEWEKVKNKHITTPVTELERQRERLLREQTYASPDDSTSEADLVFLRSSRMKMQIIARARLMNKYEKKEAARRIREWTARGVWMADKMPKPSLKVERLTKAE